MYLYITYIQCFYCNKEPACVYGKLCIYYYIFWVKLCRFIGYFVLADMYELNRIAYIVCFSMYFCTQNIQNTYHVIFTTTSMYNIMFVQINKTTVCVLRKQIYNVCVCVVEGKRQSAIETTCTRIYICRNLAAPTVHNCAA